MRRVFFGIIIFMSMVSASVSQPDDRAAIRNIIQQQIEAFQNNDVETAFSFASPNLQRGFGSAQNFGLMVQRGYPMVWRPRDFAFGPLRLENGRQHQVMIFTDRAGNRHFLDYELGQETGDWRIYSVVPITAPDVGV